MTGCGASRSDGYCNSADPRRASHNRGPNRGGRYAPNAGCVALFVTSSSGTCRLRRGQFVMDGVIVAQAVG